MVRVCASVICAIILLLAIGLAGLSRKHPLLLWGNERLVDEQSPAGRGRNLYLDAQNFVPGYPLPLLESSNGAFYCSVSRKEAAAIFAPAGDTMLIGAGRDCLRFVKVEVQHSTPSPSSMGQFHFMKWAVNVRLSWIALLSFLMGVLLLAIPCLLRKQRLRQGRCEQCGYDLRESTERCPECGTTLAESEKAIT